MKDKQKVDLRSPETIQRVWEKGKVVENFNKDLYRKDAAGAWIFRDDYGNRESKLGWEIDHVYPIENGGEDFIENLRPMNWRNNESKGNGYPVYRGVVRAHGYKNVKDEQSYTISEELQKTLKDLYDYDRKH